MFTNFIRVGNRIINPTAIAHIDLEYQSPWTLDDMESFPSTVRIQMLSIVGDEDATSGDVLEFQGDEAKALRWLFRRSNTTDALSIYRQAQKAIATEHAEADRG